MRNPAIFNTFVSIISILIQCVPSGVAASPSPISVIFGTDFLGTDGFWSPAQIRVGTPEQWLSVYPNTVGPETWVIGSGGCGGGDLKCQSLRGGIFYSNVSTTYRSLGAFELTGVNRLGYRTNAADYGLDNISLSDTISAPSQVIANLFDPETWLGELGLSVASPRFSDTTNRLSMISTLVQNASVIPSHSYGYTAGAYYALKKVPGSLVLGGVDTTRFTSNSVSFDLSSDQLPVVVIQSITVQSSQGQGTMALPAGWSSNPLTLLQRGQAARFTIDSSTPFMWLPPQVCDTFATALNLTYDNDLQLYVFNGTASSNGTTNNGGSAQALKNWGLVFTFSLANSLDDSASRVSIPITYDAFNLQLSYGFPGLKVNSTGPGVSYFPLRRANSSTQYTIGRAFLQESYLTVDYERNVFSVQPAVMVDTNTVTPKLAAITRPAGSKLPGPQTDASMSTGAKAGIAIGVVLVIALVGVAVFFVLRRKRGNQAGEKPRGRRRWLFFGSHSGKPSNIPVSQSEPPSELVADRRYPRELLVDSSNTRFELPGQAAIEMAAEEVPEAYLVANQKEDGTIIRAAELGLNNHSSLRKDYNIRATVTERPASPAPPYSAGDVARTGVIDADGEEGVSSYESSAGLNSHGSSGPAISPVGPAGPHSPIGSDGIVSPVTPEMGNTEFAASNEGNRGARNAVERSNPVALSDTIARTSSNGGRLRDDAIINQQIASEIRDENPPLRPRFSWEQ